LSWLTLGCWLITREAVPKDTPALRATSRIEVFRAAVIRLVLMTINEDNVSQQSNHSRRSSTARTGRSPSALPVMGGLGKLLSPDSITK
jgi:hypothetical protein